MNKLSAAKPNSANRLYPLVLLLGGVCFAFSSFSVRAQAQDLKGSAEAGKAKVWLCTGCHSIPDYRADYPLVYHVPKIGGKIQPIFPALYLPTKKASVNTPRCALFLLAYRIKIWLILANTMPRKVVVPRLIR